MKAQTDRKSSSTRNIASKGPKVGDRFRCRVCGMAIEVTADCRCQEPDQVHFECCGRELQKA
jgi:hypothetical protein